ncbi:MAG: hypothetical protein M0R22_07520 [Dehalococcoidia bacterium]|jgi:hypothetical protein|nr:hypothetical protein [Dehalococcoidia bacterium]
MRLHVEDWRGCGSVCLGGAVDWAYHRVALHLLLWTIYLYWRGEGG